MTDTVDVRRRRLLIGLIGLPLLGASLTGCSSEAVPKAAPGHRNDVDMDVKVRWRAVQGERALIALHAATLGAHPALSDVLAPLTARHDEHLAALEAGGPLPFAASGARAQPSPGDAPGDADAALDVPGDADAALAAVAEAETAAGQARISDCLAAAGPRFATVLASVAACETGHGSALAAG